MYKHLCMCSCRTQERDKNWKIKGSSIKGRKIYGRVGKRKGREWRKEILKKAVILGPNKGQVGNSKSWNNVRGKVPLFHQVADEHDLLRERSSSLFTEWSSTFVTSMMIWSIYLKLVKRLQFFWTWIWCHRLMLCSTTPHLSWQWNWLCW